MHAIFNKCAYKSYKTVKIVSCVTRPRLHFAASIILQNCDAILHVCGIGRHVGKVDINAKQSFQEFKLYGTIHDARHTAVHACSVRSWIA